MKQKSGRDLYKIQQLCRQVERRLSLVFAGELADHQLEGLVVVSVTPLDGASLLRVEVALPQGLEEPPSLTTILARLAAATPWLRSEIAREISRKRTPQLTFAITDPLLEDD